MNIDIEPNFYIDEEGREPWVLPENAMAIVIYPDEESKLYDSRYFVDQNSKSAKAALACMLLLNVVKGDASAGTYFFQLLRELGVKESL